MKDDKRLEFASTIMVDFISLTVFNKKSIVQDIGIFVVLVLKFRWGQ